MLVYCLEVTHTFARSASNKMAQREPAYQYIIVYGTQSGMAPPNGLGKTTRDAVLEGVG